MQKKILLIAVYFTLTGVAVYAQSKKHLAPAPPEAPQAPIENLVAPPPPPPPLPPPVPEAPALPPVPPLPPTPITEKKEVVPVYVTPVIVNSNGYEVSVKNLKKAQMIFLEKDGLTQRIRLSTWNDNRKFYEKKFGQLPTPLPVS